MKQIKIVTHYSIEDEKCSSDYYDIEVFLDGKLVMEYGDYYHDKGEEKVEGFLDAFNVLGIKYQLVQENVADREI